MKKPLKKLIGLLAFCLLGGTLVAQEKIDLSSPQSKDVPDRRKAIAAPAGQASEQNWQNTNKEITNKLGAKDVKTSSVAAGSDVTAEVESKNVETPQARLLPGGRRDPFRPFTLNARANPARKRDHLSPLERFELNQLKLVGVIADARNSNALIEDTAGLGYVVKVGTPIGSSDGKVVAIKREGIVIEESFVDLYGAQKKREVNMKLTAENVE
jgi:hypothetical protein